MQRNGIFWILTLFVVGGIGYLIADYFSTTPKAAFVQPVDKTTATASRETTKAAKRSAKNLNLDKKNNIKPEVEEDTSSQTVTGKEKIEAQFQTLRDEQRKQWQDIFGDDRDKMRAVMRSAIDNNPEFSEMFRRSRELRDNWATSSDSEKPLMLAELTDLRQKGFDILKAELEKYNNAPPAAPANDNNPSPSPNPANPAESTPPAEPEAPKEPTVIM